MPRIRIAVALATALVAFCPPTLRAETEIRFDPAPQWRASPNMSALVDTLDDWLDVNGEWQRREISPRIRVVSESVADARQGPTSSFQRGRLRGLYDPEQVEILLVAPWNPHNAHDVSTLLHELVHHRQSTHHWYCPAAQELPAYRLQDAWLAERGLKAKVNWMAVVLDAGCTPRDIHPD